MATKRTTKASKSTSFKTSFFAGRTKLIMIGLAVAVLVGGVGYTLLNQSEAATAKCRTMTFRQGSRHNCVRTLQTYVGARSDGVFGPATKGSVQAYQRSARITADGIVGPRTWGAMCYDLNGSKKRFAYLAGTIGCIYQYGRYR